MATKKVFKTSYEVVEEKGKLEGKLEGLTQGILVLFKATSLSNAEIAKMMNVDEAFVKSIRQKHIPFKQQG
jgi:predicted transposase YdaD